MPELMQSTLFTWLEWRNGSPADFLVPCREDALVGIRHRLRAATVGYCNGESLMCRPKREHKAVMFELGDNRFWFHLSNREFNRIYGGTNA